MRPDTSARDSRPGSPSRDTVAPPEERFRILVEAVEDYAIFMLDPDGCVASWNIGAQKIKGYRAQEIMGRHFSVFYPPEDIAAGKPAAELVVAEQKGRIEDEGWRVRKDGTMFWANAVITSIYTTTPEGQRQLRGFAKVTRDMSERKRLRDLEAASHHMNAFLATLAHELRNPLAPVSNALAIMKLEPLMSPTLRQCRDLIDRQISHLTRLVDDLLDAGRITTGKIALRLTPVDLNEALTRAVEMNRPHLGLRQQSVEVAAPTSPVLVNGDQARLVQIVQNLLNNASKFSEPGARIVVAIAREGAFATLRVTDSGCGIEPGALDSIFELFVQGDTRLERSESGLGIGLTLCRWLVELHGGTIAAASDGPGHGATFTVRLPLLRTQAATGDARTPEDASGNAAGEGVSVLIVDDNCDSADSMAMLLRLKGCRVRVAYNGAQALVVSNAAQIDLALIDIAMPGADGFAVLHRLKAIPAFSGTLFAAMTGFGLESDVERSLAGGFDAHLTKPVQMPLLDSLLQRAAERHGGS